MGQYNPHAPHILGQEWVPIRNAFYVPDGIVERGYTFAVDATTVPVSGAYYINEIPGNRLAQACDFISVYPAGRETLTGPIKRVRISASAITVTNVGVPSSIDVSEGVSALHNPEDSKFIVFLADTGSLDQLQVSFNTEPYAESLLNKRIIDLRLRYQLASGNVGNAENMTWHIHNQNAFKGVIFPSVTDVADSGGLLRVSTLSMTELNPTWDSAADFKSQRTVLPWRWQELNRFRASEPAASALTIFLQNEATVSAVLLGFLELEVLYCEETRVLYGGFRTYDSNFGQGALPFTEHYNVGAIAARLYNPATFTQGASLAPGEYTVTIYHRDMASRSARQGAPRIHALREYYQLARQRGVHVRQTTALDSQFTSEPSSVLTQITLHTATQIVTGVHPYGTQYGAPVYGARTAVQEIEDNPAASGAYPQVRFYARRYGHTQAPLSLVDVATGLSTVSISVAEFDALEEIVDGWREVTLRFDNPPLFPTTVDDVDWRWQATGESLAGNQWQIMVASGPSGAWNPNPTAAATGPATYWAPLGATVGLTWQSPSASGTAFDPTSDAVLIFSQDPPTVTGFGLEIASQELDVALRCDSPPGCVPTGLYYVQASWSPLGVCDMFDRVEVAQWGNASETGQLWTNTGGAASDYNVDGDSATHLLTTTGTSRNSIVTAPGADQHLELHGLSVDQSITGTVVEVDIILRHIDVANRYLTGLDFTSDGAVTLTLHSQVAGVISLLGTFTLPSTTHFPTARYGLVGEIVGTTLRAYAWQEGKPNPGTWQLSVTNGALTAAGSYGVRSRREGGNTNVNLVISIDEFISTLPSLVDGTLELQRRDSLTDWQTIMLSTRPGCLTGFADYEARVGQLSEYRMRTLNALEFAGPWVTGSATVPSPGVDVRGSATGLLIFTSNESPSSSLAYVKQFEGIPAELFSFPEADTVSLQRLFGRDFFLAVRPLERGGERFSCIILVNHAAIGLPSLANFTDLRDLAWADLNYVCVRDELGNRWFATVIVPEGTVRGARTIYLARIDVVQTTDTSSQVDP